MPLPRRYSALRAVVPPSEIPTEGVPPAVSTVTASLKLSVTSTVSPGDHAPSEPDALTDGTPTAVGGSAVATSSLGS